MTALVSGIVIWLILSAILLGAWALGVHARKDGDRYR